MEYNEGSTYTLALLKIFLGRKLFFGMNLLNPCGGNGVPTFRSERLIRHKEREMKTAKGICFLFGVILFLLILAGCGRDGKYIGMWASKGRIWGGTEPMSLEIKQDGTWKISGSVPLSLLSSPRSGEWEVERGKLRLLHKGIYWPGYGQDMVCALELEIDKDKLVGNIDLTLVKRS